MKTLKNEVYDIKDRDKDWKEINLQTDDLCKICLNTPKEGGFTPEEMRWRIKLLELFSKKEKEYQVEDADIQELKNSVSSMKWAIVHQDIVKFTDTINEL